MTYRVNSEHNYLRSKYHDTLPTILSLIFDTQKMCFNR